MWPKAYRDYKKDEFLIKYQVEPGHGIIGCEMHELNGWGTTYHIYKKKHKKKGVIRHLLSSLFGSSKGSNKDF